MTSFRARLNSPFPYYLADDRKNTWLVLAITVFVFFFLWSVHITQMPEKLDHIVIISLVTCAVLFTNIVLVPRMAPVAFDTVNWTVKKYMLFNGWQMFLIGAICSVLFHYIGYYPECPTVWEVALHFYLFMAMYGVIPLIIVTLILNTIFLRGNLQDAIHANQELQKIRELKQRTELPVSSNQLIIYSDTSETLALKLPDLLFVEANDNYSTFHWMNGHGLEKKMLRVNLKNVESQLNNSFTLRCHRSYIVNINKIDHISGNTNGYKLNIKHTELTIPVSRTKGKEVIEKIEQLRNMIELN